MTRERRRILDEVQRHAEYLDKSRPARYTAIAILGAVGLSLPWAVRAAVVNVLQDINEDFYYMQGKADEITALDKARGYLKQAAAAVGITQENLMAAERLRQQAEIAVASALGNQKLAEENLLSLQKKVQNARVELTKCQNQVAIAQSNVAEYASVWQEAYNRLEYIRSIYQSEEARGAAITANLNASSSQNYGPSAAEQERAAAIMAEWEKVGYQQNMLSEIEARFGGSLAAGSVDNSAMEAAQQEADAYWAHMDSLSAQVDEAEAEFDYINDTYESLKDAVNDAIDAENDAKDNLADLEADLAQAKLDLAAVKQDVVDAKNDRIDAMEARIDAEYERDEALNNRYEIKQSIEHFGEGDSFSTSFDFYSWQGGGRSGHQLYKGFSYFHNDKNVTLGLNTGYLNSHTGAENGGMSGWTDTNIDVTHLNKHDKYDVRYGLNINVPTGRSRTYEHAIVPEHTARFDRLGAGWNFTPKLEITQHFNKENSATWRTSYSFRGRYYNSMDHWESNINPGDIWSNELEYLYLTSRQQFMARANFLITGNSQLNGRSYGEGNQFTGKLYYKNWLTSENAWALYLAYANQEAGSEESSSTHRWYYGTGWEHRFNENNSFHLTLNWMNASGNNYDPVMQRSYLAGRRFSIAAGYDWRINDRQSASFNLERFYNNNEKAANYQGWQVMAVYNLSL